MKRKSALLCVGLFFITSILSVNVFSQDSLNYQEVKGYFHHENNVIPDIFPKYPGGTDGLMLYIAQNVEYPESAKENKIQGKVIIRYVVEKDGTIKEAEIIKGLSPEIDQECLKVVKTMDNWKPGIKNGKKVRIEYEHPVEFILN